MKKGRPICVRCGGEGLLSKINDQYFCRGCLAAARRHVYGSGDAEPLSPGAGSREVDPREP